MARSITEADVLAFIPANIMAAIHSTGLPWWAALPLAALVIRTAIVYPFFQLPTRKSAAKRSMLGPLIQADVRQQVRILELKRSQTSAMRRRFRLPILGIQTTRHVGRMFGAPFNWPLKIGGIAVLLCVTEALRKLSGYRAGVLGWLFPEGGGLSIVDAWRRGFSRPVEDQLPEPLASTTDGHANWPSLRNPDWMDPTFRTEGLPWCPDLTAADPTMILPATLIGSWTALIILAPRLSRAPKQSFANSMVDDANKSLREAIKFSSNKQDKATREIGVPAAETKKGPMLSAELSNMQRVALTFILLIMPAPALLMPAALHIYLISNIWINMLTQSILAKQFAIHPAPTACKRPVRVTATKQRLDRL